RPLGPLPYGGVALRGDRPQTRRVPRQSENGYFSRPRSHAQKARPAFEGRFRFDSMNSAQDKAWEARLDRALKALPELAAPSGLVERTLAELDRRQKPAWHKQSWIQWPLWLRAVSLVSMLAVLGGAYFAKWEFARTTMGSRLTQTLSDQFSDWT